MKPALVYLMLCAILVRVSMEAGMSIGVALFYVFGMMFVMPAAAIAMCNYRIRHGVR